MEVKYKVSPEGDLLKIQLWTTNTASLESSISIMQTIKKDDFKKAGNLIDRKSMPFRICYIALQEFNKKLVAGLARYSEYIYDDELRNSLASYIDKVMHNGIDIVPESIFKAMLDEVQAYSDSIG